jgi:hypothetical protein
LVSVTYLLIIFRFSGVRLASRMSTPPCWLWCLVKSLMYLGKGSILNWCRRGNSWIFLLPSISRVRGSVTLVEVA